MLSLLAIGYTAAALIGLWWYRKETKRIAEEVVAEETRWMGDEFERLARKIEKLSDEPPSLRLKMRSRKLFKEL